MKVKLRLPETGNNNNDRQRKVRRLVVEKTTGFNSRQSYSSRCISN